MKNQEEMRRMSLDMALKWVAVPLAIVIILASGASYNLFNYFEDIAKDQGYNTLARTSFEYTILFGYYFGIIPGIITDRVSPLMSFIVSAVLSLIAFPTLAYIEENGNHEQVMSSVLLCPMLFLAGCSGGFACLTAITVCVQSFHKAISTILVPLLLTYLKLASWFEFSLRNGYFASTNYGTYFTVFGIILAVLYGVACLTMYRRPPKKELETLFGDIDRIGILALIGLQTLLTISFYVLSLLIGDWDNGANLFCIFVVLNFVATFCLVYFSYRRMDNHDGRAILPPNYREIRVELLISPEFISLLVASFIVIGVSSTVEYSMLQISYSFSLTDSEKSMRDLFFLLMIFSMIGSGLLSSALWQRRLHLKILLLIGGTCFGIIGIVCLFLVEAIGSGMLTMAVIFLSINNGMFWAIVPQIVIRYGQIEDFGTDYGTTLLCNALGMIVCGYYFDITYNWSDGFAVLCNDGTSCLVVPNITFLLLFGVAIGLLYFTYTRIKKNIEAYMAKSGQEEKRRVAGTSTKASMSGSARGQKGGRVEGKSLVQKDKSKNKSKPKKKPKSKSKSKSQPKKMKTDNQEGMKEKIKLK